MLIHRELQVHIFNAPPLNMNDKNAKAIQRGQGRPFSNNWISLWNKKKLNYYHTHRNNSRLIVKLNLKEKNRTFLEEYL